MTLSRESLTETIEHYFAACDAANADQKKIIRPYTLSGLLFALGIDRDTFNRLCAKRKYADILCAARARIEAYLEENTLCGNLSATAAMGTLKCHFGWADSAKNDADADTSRTLRIVLDGDLAALAE